MHYGTSHFASEDAAVRYYRAYEPGASAAEVRRTVKRKIAEGEISIGKPDKPGAYLNVAEGRYFIKENPTRRKRRANPHRRRTRPTLRSMMHVRRGARGLTEREARRLAQFERRYDRLVGRSSNPQRRKRRAARRRNPRSPLFKLLAQRAGGKRLVYLGGVKFAEKGRPVYFKTPDGARTVAKLLRLQFPMLKRYAFAVAGA